MHANISHSLARPPLSFLTLRRCLSRPAGLALLRDLPDFLFLHRRRRRRRRRRDIAGIPALPTSATLTAGDNRVDSVSGGRTRRGAPLGRLLFRAGRAFRGGGERAVAPWIIDHSSQADWPGGRALPSAGKAESPPRESSGAPTATTGKPFACCVIRVKWWRRRRRCRRRRRRPAVSSQSVSQPARSKQSHPCTAA